MAAGTILFGRDPVPNESRFHIILVVQRTPQTIQTVNSTQVLAAFFVIVK